MEFLDNMMQAQQADRCAGMRPYTATAWLAGLPPYLLRATSRSSLPSRGRCNTLRFSVKTLLMVCGACCLAQAGAADSAHHDGP